MSTLFGIGKTQYSGQVKKYTSLFGSLFSDLHIVRRSPRGTETVKVPIRLGNGELRNKSNSDDIVRSGLKLPAMAFEIKSITKDANRMVNQNIRIHKGVNQAGGFNDLVEKSPVPYDIEYELGIMTNKIEDMFMILEQIVAVFNPQVTINILDNNNMALERDITVKMISDSYDIQDNYEHSQEENRVIETTIKFIVKGYMYKYTELKPITLGVTLEADNSDFSLQSDVLNAANFIQTAAQDNIGNLMSNAAGETK